MKTKYASLRNRKLVLNFCVQLSSRERANSITLQKFVPSTVTQIALEIKNSCLFLKMEPSQDIWLTRMYATNKQRFFNLTQIKFKVDIPCDSVKTEGIFGYFCCYCLQLKSGVTHLQQHIAGCHSGTFKCSLCEEVMVGKASFNSHKMNCLISCDVPGCCKRHSSKKAASNHYKKFNKNNM